MDPGYDDVRRRLVERGYLQGRVERFFLQDLLAPRPPGARLLRAALKASLLGGALLGALLVATVAAGSQPLGQRDLLLLWGYFAVVAAAGLFVLDLAVAAGIGAIARRRGARSGDALAGSLLVGLPTLGYLALLWWSHRGTAGPAADLAFLAAAVGITLLVAWLAGLVSLTRILRRDREIPARGRRATLVRVLVLLPLAAGWFWMLRMGDRESADEPPPFAVPADGARLLLLGVDGLDAALVEAFEPRGGLRGLLAQMERGSIFPLQRAGGMQPPEVWTNILTGMDAREHGVRTADAARFPGMTAPLQPSSDALHLVSALRLLLPARTVPTTGEARRVRALWEIVALRQGSVGVGWWASWPATDDPGAHGRSYVVTDRVIPKLLGGEEGDRDTLPESLFGRLRGEFAADRIALAGEFDRAFPRLTGEELYGWLRDSHMIDAYAWRVTRRLLADPDVRAAFVYLPGLDILRARLARRGADLESLLETQQALEGYVAWLDGLLVEALAGTGEARRQTVLVADPGREGSQAEGFVLLLGPRARAGCVGPVLSTLDPAPMLLDLLGYPASREMAGEIPDGCLKPGVEPSRDIAGYGRRPRSAGVEASPYDPEMLDRLRSLGYVN